MAQGKKRPGGLGKANWREEDSTRPIKREDSPVEKVAREAEKLKAKSKKATLPLEQIVDTPSEREATTEIDLDEIEVVAEKEVGGEPTARRPTAPPPPPRDETDEIDEDEWSPNPVKRLLKKFRK